MCMIVYHDSVEERLSSPRMVELQMQSFQPDSSYRPRGGLRRNYNAKSGQKTCSMYPLQEER